MALIEVRGLSFTYSGSFLPALQEITFQAEAGQMVALIGANGAGKSTLCLALAGLIPALFHGEMQGKVIICGKDTSQISAGQLAGRVGLVLQNPANQLSGMRYTVYEEVAFGLENLGVPRAEMPARIEDALTQTGLWEIRDRSPYALSGGQQQRLALASVLVMQPEVLILDEPAAMLDTQGRQDLFEVLQRIKELGTTIVIAEHQLEWLAQSADCVLLLEQGRLILQGVPQQVLTSPLLLQTGVGWLRYTMAAQIGVQNGYWPAGAPLPVTLEQAYAGFVSARDRNVDPH